MLPEGPSMFIQTISHLTHAFTCGMNSQASEAAWAAVINTSSSSINAANDIECQKPSCPLMCQQRQQKQQTGASARIFLDNVQQQLLLMPLQMLPDNAAQASSMSHCSLHDCLVLHGSF